VLSEGPVEAAPAIVPSEEGWTSPVQRAMLPDMPPTPDLPLVLRQLDAAAMRSRTLAATRAALFDAAFTLLGCHRAACMLAPVNSDGAWSMVIREHDGSTTERAEIPSPAMLFGRPGLASAPWTGEAWALGSIWPSRDADAAVAAWPIEVEEETLAVLVVQWPEGGTTTAERAADGRQLAEHAALPFGTVLRFEELEAVGTGAMRAVARMVDAVSPWTMGRSERVAAWAVELGRRLGLSRRDLRHLELGGLVHDIGKLGIPTAVLDKVGPLTTAERDLIRSHPDLGVQRLAAIPGFAPLLPMVRHHHELLDGSGYPLGLKDDEIPLLVRILTVADVFDAMRSDRAYRPGLDTDALIGVLRSGSGSRFDARVVEVLLALIEEGWEP